MSHQRRLSDDGLPIENVEFVIPVSDDGSVQKTTDAWYHKTAPNRPAASSADSLQQQQQHSRQRSGSSVDSGVYAGAETQQQQWQNWYANNAPQPGTVQYQQWTAYYAHYHHAQQGYLNPQQQQAHQAYYGGGPWPMQQQHQSRRAHSATSSPRQSPSLRARKAASVAEGYESPVDDVYAALLQDNGPKSVTGYGAMSNSKAPTANHNASRQTYSDSAQPAPPPPPPPRNSKMSNHRRSNSDGMRRPVSGLQQLAKKGGRLPTDPQRTRKTFDTRHRSNSSSKLSNMPQMPTHRPRAPSSGSAPTIPRASHRRTSSYASSGGFSAATDMSMVSVVTDIRKSVFYRGTDKGTGHAELHFPNANIHLVPVNKFDGFVDPSQDPYVPHEALMELGQLYKVGDSTKDYEKYHRATDDDFSWLDEDGYFDNASSHHDYSHSNAGENHCQCECQYCMSCSNKSSTLPQNYFCLAVEDNLYRKVVDEICSSSQMPCGLFFCGHHEDVSRPSIFIAIFVVGVLFLSMGAIAYEMQS